MTRLQYFAASRGVPGENMRDPHAAYFAHVRDRGLTSILAHCAAQDAANRNMRKDGRKVWNEDDYNIAAETLNQLWPEEGNENANA